MTRGRDHAHPAATRKSDFRDVDIAAAIDPDAVRREEIARGLRGIAAAPARVQNAAAVEDADAASGSAGFGLSRARPATGAEAKFRHINPVVPGDEQLTGSGHIGPFPLVDARAAEQLNAAVFAVGDVHDSS